MSLKALVIDSGALIKGGGGGEFERSAHKVYTVQEVVAEIKDVVTRQRLQVLPYELEIRDPSHEAVKHVTSFAKQTGDYHVLSHTDIKVMALTYQLECELSDGRGSHLRSQPIRQGKQTISLDSHHPPTGVIGMYYGPNYDPSSASVVPSVSSSVSPPVSPSPDQPSDKESCEPDELCGDENSDEDDNDGDWITLDNLHRAREQMGGATTASAEGVTVGCLTADFTMQNVLLQMGLRVLSLDGMLIKQIHYHKMYCKACCKITNHAATKFCPNCGNRALIRVKAVTDDQGQTRFTPLSIKQFSRRGLKFSLPKPTGGRHANNPITCPDQKLPNQRTAHMKKEKVDVFSPEFITRSSPFAFHDVTSRGTVGGFNKRHVDSRNPNVVKRKGKRK